MVKVYGKNNCQQCKITCAYLEKHKVEFTSINVEEDPNAMLVASEFGYRELPIVVIDKETHWSGFKPDKMDELINS